MKFSYLMFLLLAGTLIFVMSRPDPMARQAQEEAPPMARAEIVNQNSYRIKMDIDPEDQELADIVWFQKAAEVAIEKKNPWFNVIQHYISDDYIEGTIELINDPMNAEYDANEILSLRLTDEVE
jgi:hypothetical protein